jgi:hypothetical protein
VIQGDEVTCIDNRMPVVILVHLMLGRTVPDRVLTGMLRIVFQSDELQGFVWTQLKTISLASYL